MLRWLVCFETDGRGDALVLDAENHRFTLLGSFGECKRWGWRFAGLDSLPNVATGFPYDLVYFYNTRTPLFEYRSVVILCSHLVIWNLHMRNASEFGRKLLSPASQRFLR